MRIIFIFSMLIISATTYAQQSFSLQEAIDYAIKNSNDMRLAQLEVEDAEAKIMEYKSIGMPKVDAGLNYQYYFARPVNPVQDFITPAVYQVLEDEMVEGVQPYQGPPELFEFSFFQKHNVSANLNASVILFDGAYLKGLKAAKMFKELSTKSLDVKEEEIKANVTKAYMNILIAKENKDILSNNLTNINRSLTDAKATYESGFLEELDVSRLQVSFDNVMTEFENIDQLIQLSKDLLKFQMSFPQNENLMLTEDIESLVNLMTVENVDLNEEVDYNKRAQYSQIEFGYELNKLNVERLKKAYLPTVSAGANFNESLQRDNLFDSEQIGWIPQASVNLGVRVPIYDGNQKKGQIKQAEIELDKINIQKSEFERAVQLQVKTAKLNLINAKKTLSNRKASLEAIENIYDKTQIKFKEGVGSSLEVTQAEMQLFQAQGQYISALYELLVSKTDLDIALGTL